MIGMVRWLSMSDIWVNELKCLWAKHFAGASHAYGNWCSGAKKWVNLNQMLRNKDQIVSHANDIRFQSQAVFFKWSTNLVDPYWGQTFSSPPGCFHSAEQSGLCSLWSRLEPAARCLLAVWWCRIPHDCGWSGWEWTGNWTSRSNPSLWRAGRLHCHTSCK